MKTGSTLFLRTVILLIGALVLALCIFILPQGIMSDKTGYYRPIVIGMYIPAIPFFIALFQGMKLLNYIDNNRAYSEKSVRALGIIKYCAAAIAVLFGFGLPYIFYAAMRDDAPGVALIGLIFTFAPVIVSVMAAVMQKMFKNAIDIKLENDLTV